MVDRGIRTVLFASIDGFDGHTAVSQATKGTEDYICPDKIVPTIVRPRLCCALPDTDFSTVAFRYWWEILTTASASHS